MCQLLGSRDKAELQTDEVSALGQYALRTEARMNQLNE